MLIFLESSHPSFVIPKSLTEPRSRARLTGLSVYIIKQSVSPCPSPARSSNYRLMPTISYCKHHLLVFTLHPPIGTQYLPSVCHWAHSPPCVGFEFHFYYLSRNLCAESGDLTVRLIRDWRRSQTTWNGEMLLISRHLNDSTRLSNICPQQGDRKQKTCLIKFLVPRYSVINFLRLNVVDIMV